MVSRTSNRKSRSGAKPLAPQKMDMLGIEPKTSCKSQECEASALPLCHMPENICDVNVMKLKHTLSQTCFVGILDVIGLLYRERLSRSGVGNRAEGSNTRLGEKAHPTTDKIKRRLHSSFLPLFTDFLESMTVDCLSFPREQNAIVTFRVTHSIPY